MDYAPLFRSFEMIGGNHENGKKSYENTFTPGDIIALSYFKPEIFKELLDSKKQKKEVYKPGFIVVLDNLNNASGPYRDFLIKAKENYIKAVKDVFGKDTPILVLQYGKKEKISGILDYRGFELVDKENERNFIFVDKLGLNSFNKDVPLKEVEKYINLSSAGKKIFQFLYGMEGDSENSYGVFSKLGNYLIFYKHLPDAVVYMIGGDDDFEKINKVLKTREEDLKVIKVAYGHRAGGYAVIPFATEKRFESQIKKLIDYCQKENLEPIFIVQKGEKPFIFKLNNEYYGFFMRPYLLSDNKVLYNIKISGRGVKEEQDIMNDLSKGKSEHNLSGGNTGYLAIIYDKSKDKFEVIINTSKKGGKLLEDRDINDVKVKFEGDYIGLGEFLGAITPKAEEQISELEKNIKEVSRDFEKDENFFKTKKEQVNEKLKEKNVIHVSNLYL